MENVVIFYDHLLYFTAIWYNLLPFGIVCGHLVYFLLFGTFRPRKICQPYTDPESPYPHPTPSKAVRLNACSAGCKKMGFAFFWEKTN
jgi:hypothetical protein